MLPLTVQPKLDGVALEVEYRDGEFFRACLRGDGFEGQDVTEHVERIGNLPKYLLGDYPDHLIVRGEVVIPQAHPLTGRHRAAQAIKHGTEALPFCRFVAHDTPLDAFDHDRIEALGFEVVTTITGRGKSWAVSMAHAVRDGETEYQTDGVVIKLADQKDRALASDSLRTYGWAIALKW